MQNDISSTFIHLNTDECFHNSFDFSRQAALNGLVSAAVKFTALLSAEMDNVSWMQQNGPSIIMPIITVIFPDINVNILPQIIRFYSSERNRLRTIFGCD